MAIVSITIGQWHGIFVKSYQLVLEYFVGKTEATTIITYAKMTMYLITIPDIFILILILNVEVKFVGMIYVLIQF